MRKEIDRGIAYGGILGFDEDGAMILDLPFAV
jgi:hypothetical protein